MPASPRELGQLWKRDFAMTEAAGAKTFQMMHTMVRVRDLDASLDFYTRLLGMSLLRKMDFPDGRFTLAFVGYRPEETHAVVELTHNWDQDKPYEIGSG